MNASFKDLTAQDELASTALRRAQAELNRVRQAVGQELTRRALALQQALESIDDCDGDDFDELAKLSAGLHLQFWKIEEDRLLATFEGFTHGGYEVNVRLPVWLLEDDWESWLTRERAERTARKEDDKQTAARQAEARERALLAELQRKYGAA